MDQYSMLLNYYNNQLQSMLDDKIREIELERNRRSLGRLFDMGCGFTDFLQSMFCYLTLEEMNRCRCVCKKWKDFIDGFVWPHHPEVRNFWNWTQGDIRKSSVYAGGTVCCLAVDRDYLVCALKSGALTVFSSPTLKFLTILDPGPMRIWSVKLGRKFLAAITDSQVIIWSRDNGFQLVARIRHNGKFQPFLHVYGNLLVAPGETKYISRVLYYDDTKKTLKGIRDLDHGRYWVLDTCFHEYKLLTLSLFAYGTNTDRELRVWSILDGTSTQPISAKGGVGGQIQFSYPFAVLSTSNKAIDVWNVDNREHIRSICLTFFGFKVEHQFLFLMMDKQGTVKIMKMKEICDKDVDSENVWWRHLTDGSGTVDFNSAQGKFAVYYNSLMAVAGVSSDYIIVLESVDT